MARITSMHGKEKEELKSILNILFLYGVLRRSGYAAKPMYYSGNDVRSKNKKRKEEEKNAC